jgi:hypothetical protein
VKIQIKPNIIRLYGAQHPENLCLSLGTEGRNLTVIEYGDFIHFKDDEIMIVEVYNEVFGNQKSAIYDFLNDLKKGKFANVLASENIVNGKRLGITIEMPSSDPVRIGRDSWWLRFKVPFKYTTRVKGTLPLLSSLDLEEYGSLIIHDGKEFGFYSFPPITAQNNKYKTFFKIKEEILSSDIFINVDKINLISGEEERTLQYLDAITLLEGALSSYPMQTWKKDVLNPSYMATLIEEIRELFLRERSIKGYKGVLSPLLRWNTVQRAFFIKLYEKEVLRPTVFKNQEMSLRRFCKELPSGDLLKKSYSTLKYYAEDIQNYLDYLHKEFINDFKAGIEIDVVYNILKKAMEE